MAKYEEFSKRNSKKNFTAICSTSANPPRGRKDFVKDFLLKEYMLLVNYVL